jgi:hypothetical protein
LLIDDETELKEDTIYFVGPDGVLIHSEYNRVEMNGN